MLIQAVVEPTADARDHLHDALGGHLMRSDVRWFQPPDWRVRVASFGYLAFGDLTKLEDTLTDKVAQLSRLRLRMQHVVPLPEDGDDSVWVELAGDVEELAVLAQEVPGWVHGLGYLLDRYAFRPRIRLARVNSGTTVEYLERLIADVGDYTGPPWDVTSLDIVRRKPEGTPGTLYRTHVRLPLQTAYAGVRVGDGGSEASPGAASLPVPRGSGSGA